MRKLLLLMSVLAGCLFSVAQIPDAERKTAADLLQKNKPALHLSQNDLDNSFLTNTYIVPGSDVRMLYLQQSYRDIPVYNRMHVMAFRKDQPVSHTENRLKGLDQKLANVNSVPSITSEMAVRAAMTESKVTTGRMIVPVKSSANGKKLEYGNMDVSSENITSELIWFPVNESGEIKLAWQIFIAPRNSSDYWLIRVDAATGKIINKESLTVYCNWDKTDHSLEEHLNKHVTGESIKKNIQNNAKNKAQTASRSQVVNNATYRIIPFPSESPIHPGGAHSLISNPWILAPGNATSLGWHFDGSVYYENTRGNNAYAYEDRNNDNLPGLSGVSSTVQPNLTFDFVPDYNLQPTITSPAPNQQFNTTNLFYWNNLVHDLSYIYGFTESARNFQNNNQGRGGAGADYVLAEAQDGGGSNNANFATPADGSRPRMQMYLWSPKPGTTTLHVNSPGSIARDYVAAESDFSPNNKLVNVGPVTGDVVYYNDAAGTHEACSGAPTNNLAGKIALIKRGNCNFTVKVSAAQTAGAIAVIMINNVAGDPIVMGGGPAPSITIPAIMVSDVDGATIASQLGNGVNATMSATPGGTVNLDGDVDNGIIIHEYTHGISNRLTGNGYSCLGNAEQMGEGWSDYLALMMTHDWASAQPGDGFSKPRGIGTYALGQPITGVGIRQYRYTTDMSVNPLTYANLSSVAAPHGVGTIWCSALWDMTWEIIQTAGINPSLHNLAANGGNAIALKLVIEGLRLQPCSPGFIDGRNAILKADTAFYGAQFSCAIINAFARRGMGIGASQGSSNVRGDETISFVGCTPVSCNAPVGLTSSSITTNSATVSWTAVNGAVSYDVDYKPASSGTWSPAATGTTSISVNLSGLTASTLYDWRVRTNCNGSSSDYSQAQLTTASACAAPSGLSSSAITYNSATVSWAAVSGAVSYDVDYKLASSNTWTSAATGTTSTSVNLFGLTASSVYDWRVRTNCNGSSSGYSQAQFTTTASPNGCPGIYDVSTNGTTGGAAIIPLNTDVKGTISPANDNDYYRFHITNGGTITVTLSTLPANYQLDLLNSAGSRIGRSANNGTANETINATVTTGDYYARVYPKGNANNAAQCYTLKVITGTASFGEGEIIVGNRINAFPNPVNNTVTVNIPGIRGQADIRVLDLYGRSLIQKSSFRLSTLLDVSSLVPGIYLVKVKNDGKVSIIKIVKE